MLALLVLSEIMVSSRYRFAKPRPSFQTFCFSLRISLRLFILYFTVVSNCLGHLWDTLGICLGHVGVSFPKAFGHFSGCFLFVCVLACLSVCVPACLSVCLSFCLPVCRDHVCLDVGLCLVELMERMSAQVCSSAHGREPGGL